MHHLFRRLHRWFGLFTAVFLFIAGATGAVISWDHELDSALNPAMYHSEQGPQRPALDLADAVEAAHPRARVSYLPLAAPAGEALQVWVEPRVDPVSRQPYELAFNQLALNPVTGAEQGRRLWGDVSLTRENLLPFLYKLHYSLELPLMGGYDVGSLFMGIVAIVWVLDAFVSLLLSFPHPRSWRKSLAFRWQRGGHALTFDVHRSGGVWIWLLLLVLAVTAVSMNLRSQVVVPVVSAFSKLTPNPYDTRAELAPAQQAEPGVSRRHVLALARAEAARRGWTAPAGAILYSPEYGMYGVGFFEPDDEHGDGGLGNPWLYFNAGDGSPAGADIPGTGSAGDIFLQAQFPLHSGRIIGVAGRVIVSLVGLAVAALSVTGLLLWWRRRRAQHKHAVRSRSLAAQGRA
ncbi:peptidase [Frateuria sp. Soil773]|uniref:PepSY-associated TM helix domain-containing protein n=1 Tax=Frateuria sp. Soil773 TaxID=1736407 RepID=UPI0006F27B39|nr:PepSY-associated TM helix domain-containing protein [Frateuria sp. Soil773]KRF02214.1 peptidase [Frateuria sp. Soil773]